MREPDEVSFDSIYRQVVRQTRYGGAYEGGRWIAFVGDFDLPDEADGEDTVCREWWQGGSNEHPRTARIGRGQTAEAALADLEARWEAAGSPLGFDWHQADGVSRGEPTRPTSL